LKTLIISPQAGMCNRFRAICSAILLGKLTGRKIFHNWIMEPALPDDIDIIRHMRESSFTTFFKGSNVIPFISLDEQSSIDEVYSEWGSDNAWYERQSSAIDRCKLHNAVRVEENYADSILESNAETILLETSLALKHTKMSDDEFETALSEIYTSHFQPLEKFSKIADEFSNERHYVGVHIRRTDHLKYINKADISVQAWARFITKRVSEEQSIYLCSDDKKFTYELANKLGQDRVLIFEKSYEPKTQAFLEFLCLSKAEHIFGTLASSFSREAGLFGNKPVTICSAHNILPSWLNKMAQLIKLNVGTINHIEKPQPQVSLKAV